MIIHISNSDKFIFPLIELLNAEISPERSSFYVIAEKKIHFRFNNVNEFNHFSFLGYLKLFIAMLFADKIILHSLFNNRIIFFFFLCPFLLPKTYWLIWGWDLYKYRNPKEGLKKKLLEFLRSRIIKKVGYLVTYIPGDVELARKWYGAGGKHLNLISYLSNTVENPRFVKGKGLVLIGNSANPTNHHIEVFKFLEADSDFLPEKLVVPLSYGDREYAKQIILEGEKIFGEKFMGLTTFLPIQDYLKLLSDIDIAIFAHDRQQAMGNILNLLGMGKTIFLRRDMSHTCFLESQGFKFKYLGDKISEISIQDKLFNIELVRQRFSKDVLLKEWKEYVYS